MYLLLDKKVAAFKKAAQKFLLLWAPGVETGTAQSSKSFLLLFFKKEALPFA
jgi:hypothetical protein